MAYVSAAPRAPQLYDIYTYCILLPSLSLDPRFTNNTFLLFPTVCKLLMDCRITRLNLPQLPDFLLHIERLSKEWFSFSSRRSFCGNGACCLRVTNNVEMIMLPKESQRRR